MKTENTISFCGSITKTESLIPISANILENTWVAEANLPYAGYYGVMPEKIKANTLFLFTNKYYPLDEVLRFAEGFKHCYTERIDAASATLEFQNKQYPAIRVKNFADYKHLHVLQNCFKQEGVEFAQKINFMNEAKAVINKCFELKEIDQGIYIDRREANKGYLFAENRLNRKNFQNIVQYIKNNSSCTFFDAVTGTFIKDTHTKDFIRIYTEGMNIEILKCIKYQFQKNNIETTSVNELLNQD